jgi:hypothetical protein
MNKFTRTSQVKHPAPQASVFVSSPPSQSVGTFFQLQVCCHVFLALFALFLTLVFYFFTGNSYLLSPVPAEENGYFDSKVSSGQHAEVSYGGYRRIDWVEVLMEYG